MNNPVRYSVMLLALFVISGCSRGEADYVAVVGVGEAKTFPDFAQVTAQVNRKAPTAAKATEAVNEQVGKLLAVAEKMGADRKKAASTYFGVRSYEKRVRRPDGSTVSEQAGFVAQQNMAFEIDDIHRAGELLGRLIAAGAESASQPSYKIRNEAEIFEAARALAIEDAKQRAGDYAAATGRHLGKVIIIEESGTKSQRLNFNLRDRITRWYAQKESNTNALRPSASVYNKTRGPSVFSQPKEVSVSVSIYAKFELKD